MQAPDLLYGFGVQIPSGRAMFGHRFRTFGRSRTRGESRETRGIAEGCSRLFSARGTAEGPQRRIGRTAGFPSSDLQKARGGRWKRVSHPPPLSATDGHDPCSLPDDWCSRLRVAPGTADRVLATTRTGRTLMREEFEPTPSERCQPGTAIILLRKRPPGKRS